MMTVAANRIRMEWRCFYLGRQRRQAWAAVLLQRRYRGWVGRRFLVQTLAARVIQFHVRRWFHRCALLRLELLNVAVLTIQRRFIARQQKRCRALQALAAEAVSAHWRRKQRLLDAEQRQEELLLREQERTRQETIRLALARIDDELGRKGREAAEQLELRTVKQRFVCTHMLCCVCV